MELGEKLKQARLEAGLSQRQLCGEEITRNMLSQIENGAAWPSMATLQYLAGRLGKNISYFLEEDAVTSPNQQVMEKAREAFDRKDWQKLGQILEEYRSPDPVFDREAELLRRCGVLETAKIALAEGKNLFGAEILEDAGFFREGYCAEELERRRLMLLAEAKPKSRSEILARLPGMDEELLLRARDALERGAVIRCLRLLEAAEERQTPLWNYLRGEVHFAQEEYSAAINCYLKAEELFPDQVARRLEHCYREMGNFERAYFYACLRRERE